jgi:hypothetical protein
MKLVHILMKEDLWTAIQREADKKGQTASAEIRRVLFDAFAEKTSEAEQ